MEQDLFRKEFLEARARADFGEVALPPQRAVRIAAVVSMVTVALLLAVLATLPYTRMETNMGFVISDADAFAVTSAFKGPVRVENILVGSGDLIMPGKPMLVVSMETGEEGLENESRSNSLAVMTNSRRTDGVEGGRKLATLLSTQRGYFDKLLVLPGEDVVQGQPILLLRRERGHIAFRVLADSRSIGFLEEGQTVFIRVEAFPFQRFGTVRGHIAAISESSLSPYQAATMFGMQPPGQNRFLVDVAIDDPRSINGSHTLKPGMSVRIDFPVERTSVLGWIFSSLFKLGKRNEL